VKIKPFSTPGIIEQDFVYAGSTYWARTHHSAYQVATRRADGESLAFTYAPSMVDGTAGVRLALGPDRFAQDGRVLGWYDRTEQAGPLQAELERLLRAGHHFERYANSFAQGGKRFGR
jgi:hypothetical protein